MHREPRLVPCHDDCVRLKGWPTGLEPATPGITTRCSNQLSYGHHQGPEQYGAWNGLANPGANPSAGIRSGEPNPLCRGRSPVSRTRVGV